MKSKKHGHVLVNVEGVVYSIGGRNEKDEVLNTIEIFDPVNEQWKMLDVKLNIARTNHQVAAHKHFIYIFGGWDGKMYTDTIERFNVKTEQIELLDVKLHVGRCGFAVGKVDSDVYILGGESWDDDDDARTVLCEIFNLQTEEIRKGENLPDSNSDRGLTACVV